MQRSMVQKLAHVGLLVAVEVVLSRFLSISTFNLKIGFGFIPVAIAAVLYGPMWGAVTAGLADFLGAVLFPIGPYFPGFTLTAMLMGASFGFFLYRERGGSLGRVIAAVAINRIPLSLGLNTLWISVLYGKGFMALLPGRVLQEAVLIPIQVIAIWFITQKLPQFIKRRA